MIRSKAFLVDMFMIGMPISYLVIYIIMGGGHGFASNKITGWGIIVGIHAPIYIALLNFKSQTPGMKAYGLKLVTIKAQSNPGFLQILLRYILTPLSIFSIIGVLTIKIRKDGLGLHDVLSGTKIIYTNTK
jgi:uncharacterized RDD family membrane protein YckC